MVAYANMIGYQTDKTERNYVKGVLSNKESLELQHFVIYSSEYYPFCFKTKLLTYSKSLKLPGVDLKIAAVLKLIIQICQGSVHRSLYYPLHK